MSFSLREAAEDARAGRKAQTLARLLGAGFPVLPGIVVPADDPLFDLDEQLSTLGGGPYAVRSSSTVEDLPGASAAGLYRSETAVGADAVRGAIGRVRASAQAPMVTEYLTARGLHPGPIAVLVQPDMGALRAGVARSAQGGFLVEEREPGAAEWEDARLQREARDGRDPLVALLVRAEALLGGALDVEYARRGDEVLVLQARPVPREPAPALLVGCPPGRWRLDAEHNPDPISAAQAGLVALVDGPRFGPRARVIGGYLYGREDAARNVRVGDDDDALRRFHEVVEPALRAELNAAEGAPLATALGVYVRVMRRYAKEARPPLGAARAAMNAILGTELGESLWEHERLLGGSGGATSERDAALYALGRDPSEERLTDYLARFGAYAPAWDVAVACDEEDRPRLLAQAARRALGPSAEALAGAARTFAEDAVASVRDRLARDTRPRFDRALARLRRYTSLAESDDAVFFEGQRLVRRALRETARVLVRTGRLRVATDIFDLPLTAAVMGRGPLDELASRGRRARHLAARAVPPVRIVDRVPHVRLPASSEVLRGRGVGGAARGPAYVVRSLHDALISVREGAVLIVPAALPSLAPLLPRLAGLVTEHGGALSHAITLAREIGLPAVVGVAGALSIASGTRLYIDGERGRVIKLRGPRT